MTETLTKTIVDCSTGESTVVPMTAEEITQLEADQAAAQASQLAAQEEAAAKAEVKASALAKLAALGLTEEEAATLVI